MFTLLQYLDLIIEPEIRQFCGPLFFTRSLDSPKGNIAANGTFGLVDTGKEKLLVTCQHVWEEFQKERSIHPELKLALCLDQENPVVFSPLQPIDHDKKLDMATFDASPFLPACGRRKFYPLNQNPAPRVQEKDLIAFVGYPGRFRYDKDESVEFGRILYSVRVGDVSGMSVFADMSKTTEEFNGEPSQKAHGDRHGGISGSPVFLVKVDRPSQLMGFVHSVGLNVLRISHARCLNLDGSLNTQAI